MFRTLMFASAVAALIPTLGQAQQGTAAVAANPQMMQGAGVLVVSQQKCKFSAMPQLDTWWRANAAPILNDLVRQGSLRAWGVFEHAWGDEWNWGIYYIGNDLNSFNAAFDQFFGTLHQRQPQMMAMLDQACSEHRDNIYDIAMTEMTTGGMPMQMAPRP